MEEVIDVFKKLKIDYDLISHPAIFNRKDEEIVKNIDFKGTCCKNLFLKDKKTNKFYLVSLPVDKKADLKMISDEIGSHRLSFGNDEELMSHLNIKSGSVSILNVIGAPSTDVLFIIDKELMNENKVSFHPNDNRYSISFSPKYLTDILDLYNKKYIFIEVEEKN